MITNALRAEITALKLSWRGKSLSALMSAFGLCVYLASLLTFLILDMDASELKTLPKWCGFALILICAPMLETQIKTAFCLRQQRCPFDRAAVYLVLRWALFLWMVVATSFAVVIALADMFKSGFGVPMIGITVLTLTTSSRSTEQMLLLSTVFIGIWAIIELRGALKCWRDPDARQPFLVQPDFAFRLPRPSRLKAASSFQTFPFLPDVALVASPPKRTKAASAGGEFAGVLAYFGIAKSPWFYGYTTAALMVIASIGIAARLSLVDQEQARLMLALICATCVVLSYLRAAGKWTQVYVCLPERAWLSCVPGLPDLTTQGAYLQRALWQYLLPRFLLPTLLAAAISPLLDVALSVGFFCALMAAACVGAAALQYSFVVQTWLGRRTYGGVWAVFCFLLLMAIWLLCGGPWVMSALYAAVAGLCVLVCFRANPALGLTFRAL
jgi:hypothetical protein